MRRTTLVVAMLGLAVLLLLGSCHLFGWLNPVWALEGSWSIAEKPAGSVWDIHETFVILPGAESYQIRDDSGAVFESVPISNLTETGFEYTMEEYTPVWARHRTAAKASALDASRDN